MTDIAKHFIAQSRGFLSSDYLPKIERCLEVLSDEDVWWRANEGSNSIGNLLLHLEGSTRTWIIGVIGENQVSEVLLLAPNPKTNFVADGRERLPGAPFLFARR